MAGINSGDPTKVTRATARALVGCKPRKAIQYRTDAEKKEARESHRELLDLALEALTEPHGMSAWLVSRHIHGDTQTPGNIALAALQAPGQLVGTYAQWSRTGLKPRKGQTAELVLTGKTFWPVAAWTSRGHNVEMPPLPVPDAGHCSRLAESWATWPTHSTEGLEEWIRQTRPELIEGNPVEVKSDEIPW